MIGAKAAELALTTLLAAKKEVAWPGGDSFIAMLPDASATPAVAIPISTWIASSMWKTKPAAQGIPVKVQANVQSRKRGAEQPSTALLVKRSIRLPHRLTAARLLSWLAVVRITTSVIE